MGIFPLISTSDIVNINELTDIKYVMMLRIKTITSVLNVSTNIITGIATIIVIMSVTTQNGRYSIFLKKTIVTRKNDYIHVPFIQVLYKYLYFLARKINLKKKRKKGNAMKTVLYK